jgi:hypothetical protein
VVDYGLVVESRNQLERWVDNRCENSAYRVVYRPEFDRADRKALRREAEFLSRLAGSITHIEIFFDEIDTFGRGDDDADSLPELFGLLNFARKDYVSIRGTVRRPQVKVPRDWITETTRCSIFQVIDPLDCAVLEKRTEIPAEEFRKLQKFEFWEWFEGEKRLIKMGNPYFRG